jgi:hypothetical protein
MVDVGTFDEDLGLADVRWKCLPTLAGNQSDRFGEHQHDLSAHPRV